MSTKRLEIDKLVNKRKQQIKMPPRNDEVNVFKIPHGRMLQLVNKCNKKVNISTKSFKIMIIIIINYQADYHRLRQQ